MKKSLNWEHRENEFQEYFEAKDGPICVTVFRNKSFKPIKGTAPERPWMAMIGSILLLNREENNKERRRQGLPITKKYSGDVHKLSTVHVLSNARPELMMRKAERAYWNGLRETT